MICGMATGDELINEIRKQTALLTQISAEQKRSFYKLRSIEWGMTALVIVAIVVALFGVKLLTN